MKYITLTNRKIIILGFGSIGPTALFLVLKHVSVDQVIVISDSDINRSLSEEWGVKFESLKLTPENYKTILTSRLEPDDILLNLSVGVSSLDIISFCQKQNVLYLDTSNETWPSKTIKIQTTTYERRQKMLQAKARFVHGPTALICHGANPGLVSHFAKQAVLDVATSMKIPVNDLNVPDDWARIAQASKIIALHISERDTQHSYINRSPEEYVNTWSVDGFLEEASENVGFPWGTHEEEIPKQFVKIYLETAKCRIIELKKLGANLSIKSWIPSKGIFSGYLIPHPESYSIAELFTQRHNERLLYHPTVHFVYQPCPDAVSSMQYAEAQRWTAANLKRLLLNDIIDGMDELGILVIRKHTPEIYWFGSQLDINEVRSKIPNTNATTLQVAAGVLSGLVWLVENPRCGLVEPEEIDFKRVIEIAAPYLGTLRGHWSTWPEQTYPKSTSEALKLQLCYSSIAA